MKDKKQNSLLVSITLFAAMAVIYAVLIIAARNMSDPYAQNVMISSGSAILGSGLVYFLIRVS